MPVPATPSTHTPPPPQPDRGAEGKVRRGLWPEGSAGRASPAVEGGQDHSASLPPIVPFATVPGSPPLTRRSRLRRLIAAGLRCEAPLGLFDLTPPAPAAASYQMSPSPSPLRLSATELHIGPVTCGFVDRAPGTPGPGSDGAGHFAPVRTVMAIWGPFFSWNPRMMGKTEAQGDDSLGLKC